MNYWCYAYSADTDTYLKGNFPGFANATYVNITGATDNEINALPVDKTLRIPIDDSFPDYLYLIYFESYSNEYKDIVKTWNVTCKEAKEKAVDGYYYFDIPTPPINEGTWACAIALKGVIGNFPEYGVTDWGSVATNCMLYQDQLYICKKEYIVSDEEETNPDTPDTDDNKDIVIGPSKSNVINKINTKIDGKINEPETEGTRTQVLHTDGDGNRYWDDTPYPEECEKFDIYRIFEKDDAESLPTIIYTRRLGGKLTDVEIGPVSEYIYSHEYNEELDAYVITLSSVFTEFPDNFLYQANYVTSIKFLNFGNVRKIGNNFLARQEWNMSFTDRKGLEEVDLSGFYNVTEIGNYFLYDIEKILSPIDLSPLSHVTKVGSYFLGDISSIVGDIDLSPLSNVTEIGSYFLSYYAGSSIDVSPLSKVKYWPAHFLYGGKMTRFDFNQMSQVTEIRAGFINYWRNVTSVDISPLDKVETIDLDHFLADGKFSSIDLSPIQSAIEKCEYTGNYFLYSCTAVTKIDFSIFRNIKHIGNDFISWNSFSSINLSAFSNVETIGNYFLYYNRSLTSVDLSPFTKVKKIGSKFLYSCEKLKSADLSFLTELESIGGDFLDGCKALTSFKLPVMPQVTTLPSGFLNGCTAITSVDLSCFPNLEKISITGCTALTEIIFPEGFKITGSIPSNFLSKCTSLRSFDFSIFQDITSIGDNFMYGVPALADVDLSIFSNITTIPNYFLCNIPFTEIDLSVFSNVTYIGNYFLNGCINITSIDLSPLSDVTYIGDYFLSGCNGIESIDLSPLSGVTHIGSNFMSECKGLTTIDLDPLNVDTLPQNLLYNCTNLTEIKFGHFVEIYKQMKHIPNDFMKGYSGLKTLDLSFISGAESIGENFLYGCTGLESLDLTPLKNVKTIGKYFLYNCTGLKSLDLSPIAHVFNEGQYIPEYFLYGCTSLSEVTFGDISDVTHIGQYFLTRSAIKSIDLSMIKELKFIDSYFLNNCEELEEVIFPDNITAEYIRYQFLCFCKKLKHLDLSKFTSVKYIGYYFLYYCTELESLDISGFSNVEYIDQYFLYWTEKLESLDLSILSNVKVIGRPQPGQPIDTVYGYFMYYAGIKHVDMSSFTQLEGLPQYTFYGCKQLETFIMKDMPNIIAMGGSSISSLGENTESIIFDNVSNIERWTSGNFFWNSPNAHIEFKNMDTDSFPANFCTPSMVAGGGRFSVHDCTVTELPTSFFSGIGYATNIEIYNLPNVTNIPASAFQGCGSLKKLSIHDMENLESISTVFGGNSVLEELEIYNCPKLTALPEGFCNGLSKLKKFDFSTIPSITAFPNSMLCGCGALEEVIFGENDNITTIPAGAFQSSGLKSLDFTSLSYIETINNTFSSSSYLESINMSGLTNLTYVAKDVFGGLSYLESIDMSGCTSLESITFGGGIRTLTSLDLTGCTSISYLVGLSGCAMEGEGFAVDLTSLTNLERISGLSGSNITSIDMSGLTNLTYIAEPSLQAISPVTVNMSGVSNLESLPSGFLSVGGAIEPKMTTLNLSGMSSLTTIPAGCAYNTYTLTNVDLTGCYSVTSINGLAFSNCTSLQTLDLSPCVALESIPDNFLSGCESLTELKTPYIDTNLDMTVCSQLTSLYLTGDDVQEAIADMFDENTNEEFKIYVKEELLEQYQESFETLSDKFIAIN